MKYIRSKLHELARGERGLVLALVALALVVLMGSAALAVDVGWTYETRRDLQNAVDGAALAGAQELPVNPDQARARAYDYASRNGVPAGEVESIEILDVFNDNDAIRVTARRNIQMFFGRALNWDNQDVRATATGLRTPATPECDIWPWAIEENRIPAYNVPVTLKVQPGNQTAPGNFGALDFWGSGANAYRDNIKNGFCGLQLGMNVPVETGNITGPTAKGAAGPPMGDPDSAINRCGHIGLNCVNIAGPNVGLTSGIGCADT